MAHRHNDAGKVLEGGHLQNPVTAERITLQRLAIFTLVGYCAALICGYLPTFRGSLSTPYSRVKQSKEILFGMLDPRILDRQAVPKRRYPPINTSIYLRRSRNSLIDWRKRQIIRLHVHLVRGLLSSLFHIEWSLSSSMRLIFSLQLASLPVISPKGIYFPTKMYFILELFTSVHL